MTASWAGPFLGSISAVVSAGTVWTELIPTPLPAQCQWPHQQVIEADSMALSRLATLGQSEGTAQWRDSGLGTQASLFLGPLMNPGQIFLAMVMKAFQETRGRGKYTAATPCLWLVCLYF